MSLGSQRLGGQSQSYCVFRCWAPSQADEEKSGAAAAVVGGSVDGGVAVQTCQ